MTSERRRGTAPRSAASRDPQSNRGIEARLASPGASFASVRRRDCIPARLDHDRRPRRDPAARGDDPLRRGVTEGMDQLGLRRARHVGYERERGEREDHEDGAEVECRDTKKRLTKLLSTTQQQTKVLLADVKGAGKPDVKGGQQIAATMREGFAQVQRTVAQAKRSLAQAPTTDPTTFMTAARTGHRTRSTSRTRGHPGRVLPPDADCRTAAPLLKAFAANDDCRATTPSLSGPALLRVASASTPQRRLAISTDTRRRSRATRSSTTPACAGESIKVATHTGGGCG